jgi:hypothetical protein
MKDGTISKNTSSGSGGGVCVGGRTFIMEGGTISGNSTSQSGGGVYVASACTFTKTNGVITGYGSDTVNGNVVSQNSRGHAVYVDGGTKRLEKTVSASHNLNSKVGGAAGGWVDE